MPPAISQYLTGVLNLPDVQPMTGDFETITSYATTIKQMVPITRDYTLALYGVQGNPDLPPGQKLEMRPSNQDQAYNVTLLSGGAFVPVQEYPGLQEVLSKILEWGTSAGGKPQNVFKEFKGYNADYNNSLRYGISLLGQASAIDVATNSTIGTPVAEMAIVLKLLYPHFGVDLDFGTTEQVKRESVLAAGFPMYRDVEMLFRQANDYSDMTWVWVSAGNYGQAVSQTGGVPDTTPATLRLRSLLTTHKVVVIDSSKMSRTFIFFLGLVFSTEDYVRTYNRRRNAGVGQKLYEFTYFVSRLVFPNSVQGGVLFVDVADPSFNVTPPNMLVHLQDNGRPSPINTLYPTGAGGVPLPYIRLYDPVAPAAGAIPDGLFSATNMLDFGPQFARFTPEIAWNWWNMARAVTPKACRLAEIALTPFFAGATTMPTWATATTYCTRNPELAGQIYNSGLWTNDWNNANANPSVVGWQRNPFGIFSTAKDASCCSAELVEPLTSLTPNVFQNPRNPVLILPTATVVTWILEALFGPSTEKPTSVQLYLEGAKMAAENLYYYTKMTNSLQLPFWATISNAEFNLQPTPVEIHTRTAFNDSMKKFISERSPRINTTKTLRWSVWRNQDSNDFQTFITTEAPRPWRLWFSDLLNLPEAYFDEVPCYGKEILKSQREYDIEGLMQAKISNQLSQLMWTSAINVFQAVNGAGDKRKDCFRYNPSINGEFFRQLISSLFDAQQISFSLATMTNNYIPVNTYQALVSTFLAGQTLVTRSVAIRCYNMGRFATGSMQDNATYIPTNVNVQPMTAGLAINPRLELFIYIDKGGNTLDSGMNQGVLNINQNGYNTPFKIYQTKKMKVPGQISFKMSTAVDMSVKQLKRKPTQARPVAKEETMEEKPIPVDDAAAKELNVDETV